MRKAYFVGTGAVVALMLVVGVAGGFGHEDPKPQPSMTDVEECNEYARWIAQREMSESRDQAADESLPYGALVKTGTIEGLAESNQENARAANAYRQCMLRRGYKAWG